LRTVFALGYEDLVDHDQLRHDPAMAVLAIKLSPSARIAYHWRGRARSAKINGDSCVKPRLGGPGASADLQ
jgi:hypothetical protein